MFSARVVGGQIQVSDETSEVAWWPPEIVAGGMDQALAVRILDALRHAEPAVRAHDGVSLLDDIATLPDIEKQI